MYNPREIEHEILEFWKRNEIFEKLVEKNKGKKKFSFLDGPITANNPMGVHHAWGRTLKDLFQRFKAMQGFDQRFQNGFDCQGLWVEVEVEKSLGFNSKKDIENFGLENFSKACRERVNKFAQKITEQSIRLGQWMDWKNSYYTFDDSNIEAIWYFLKKCFEKGWLYKGTRVLPWCIRCGTSSSKHEMSDQGYAELVHPGLFVKFKIKGSNEYLLVWTTTAWTLTANVAAAVHPEFNYAKVEVDGEVFYLSEKRLTEIGKNYKIIGLVKGSDLIGLEYESPYEHLEAQKGVVHKVVGWDLVSEEEGTGIVHIAPGCGEEDEELGKELGLPKISPLDEAGYFIEGFGNFTGKNVKGIAKEIIDDLKKRNLLFKVEDYKHRYPVCWRCKEELVFRLGTEWFIKVDEIRPLMKEAASKVNWIPEYAGKRMQDWLDNMGDWNISRKRYWGLPLMFFECKKCGNLEVIGSKKELREKAVDKKAVDDLPELHRPWIDKIKIRCSKCDAEIERIREVGDCWLDAGIVPFSTIKYFEDKEYWKQWFPVDLVLEGIPQVKLWFYATLFMSVTLENVAPYKNVVTTELVVDEKGEEMHKSKGNVIWFDEAVEKMGADVMRWLYVTQSNRANLKFGYNVAKDSFRILNIFYNTVKYVKTYCEANNYVPEKKNLELNAASKWIFSRLENVKKNVTKYLESFEYYKASAELENFVVNDLSRWYIHIVRSTLKPGKEDNESILYTLYFVTLDVLKMLAPFIPFVTEKLYQDFFVKFEKIESIHLNEWPSVNEEYINENLETEMEIVRNIFEACSFARQKANLKLRWPVKEVIVVSDNKDVINSVEDLKEIILTVCNTESVKVVKEKPIGEYSEAIFDYGSVLVYNKLDEKLLNKAFIRELIRYIQDLRKKNNLNVGDKIDLYIDSDEKTNKLLKSFENELKAEVGAKNIFIGKFDKKESKGVFEFEDKTLNIMFYKI